jgi:hypothetical protein
VIITRSTLPVYACSVRPIIAVVRAWSNNRGKKSTPILNYGGGLLYPQTIKRFVLLLNFAKPAKLPPQAVLDGGFATVTIVLSFSFLFISSKSSKNHSKSQKKS